MANKKISQLTDGTSFQSGDEAVVNRGGTNYKVDPTQFGSSIDVTGTVTADGLSLTGTTNSPLLTLAANNDAANPGPANTLRFEDTDGVVQPGQQTGRIEFYTNDTYGAGPGVNSYINVDSDQYGRPTFTIGTGETGAVSERLRINYLGNTTINEGGADADFRVESDTQTHALFVDAGNSRVGINTSSPATTLDVNGTVTATEINVDNLQLDGNTISSTDTDGDVILAPNGTGQVQITGTQPASLYGAGGNGLTKGDPLFSISSSGILAASLVGTGAAQVVFGTESAGGGAQAGTNIQFWTNENGYTGTSVGLRAVINRRGGFVTTPIANGSAVFNEDGVDADFRVESDNNTHAFFVDAGNSRVGINTSSPATALDVNGTVTADGADLDGAVVINESGADVDFRVESDNNANMLFVDAGNDRVGIGTSSPATQFSIKSNSSELRHHVYPNQNFGALNTWYRVAEILKAGSVSGFIGEIEFGVANFSGTTGAASGYLRINITGRWDSLGDITISAANGYGNLNYAIRSFRIATESGRVYLEILSNSNFSIAAFRNAYIRGANFVPLQLEDASGSTPVAAYTVNDGEQLIAFGSALDFYYQNTLVGTMNANGFAPAAGKGIDFSATSGTGTSELFDDYEEGNWTPVLSDGTNNATTNAGNTEAKYTKIGRTVYVNCVLTISSLGSCSGNMRVTGLPFTINSYHAGCIGRIFNVSITSGESFSFYGPNGNTYVALYLSDSATGTTLVQHTELTATTELTFSMTYTVA